MGAVLIIYLATASTSTGMTMATAEYASIAACEKAGEQAKDRFGGWYTTVRWSCSPKGGEGPAAPQAR